MKLCHCFSILGKVPICKRLGAICALRAWLFSLSKSSWGKDADTGPMQNSVTDSMNGPHMRDIIHV